jgi:integrase
MLSTPILRVQLHSIPRCKAAGGLSTRTEGRTSSLEVAEVGIVIGRSAIRNQPRVSRVGFCAMDSAITGSSTGIRQSELLALEWSDIDFSTGTMNVARSIVHGFVGPCKTESCQKPVPIHPLVVLALNYCGQMTGSLPVAIAKASCLTEAKQFSTTGRLLDSWVLKSDSDGTRFGPSTRRF